MKIIKITIWIVIAVLLILYSCGCENQELGAGGTSCTYSGSGDWYVKAKDLCFLSSNTTVQGTLYILADEGSGSFNIIDNAILAVHGIKNTSTPINVESGSKITIDNQGG